MQALKDLIQEIIDRNSKWEIKKIFEDYYAVDIAEELDEFDEEDILKFISIINNEQLAKIIEYIEDNLDFILMSLDIERMVDMFTYMSPDDVVDIVSELPIVERKNVLNKMKRSDSKDVRTLLAYGGETAGGIMTTEYLAVKDTYTVREAINKIKQIGPKTEIIEIIYVVGSNGVLLGKVDLRDILVADEDELIENIIDDTIVTVEPDTDQEDVALLVSKYDLKVIPVVSRNNIIIGIITIDDIIDVLVEEQAEDILAMGGVSKEERFDSNLKTSIKTRLPWLCVNLLTAFIASTMVSLFSSTIAQVVVLAAAMPIVAGLGGNAGAQTLSVVIRSIAFGEIDLKEDWQYVFKEALLGVLQGMVIGIIAGSIFAFKYNNMYLGFIVLASMIINLMIASFFGYIIPLILKKIGVDPAVASSIFLTAITDTFGFFVFLGLASIFLPFLI